MAGVEAVEAEHSTGADSEMHIPLPGVIVPLHEDANRILMSRADPVGAAAILGQKAVLSPPRDPDLDQYHPLDHRHLVDVAMRTGDVAVQSATPFLPTGGIVGGQEVQTTVIEIDPLPAVIRRAHVLPEETEGRDPSPTVFPRLLRGIGVREDTPLCRGHDPGHRIALAVTGDKETRRLIITKEIEEKKPLILERPAIPVMIAV